MGMVFQSYAVWPHKTVAQNVAFGLEVRRVGRAEIRARVARVLELVNLTGLGPRYPSQLSGGQQQRVALARSLVVEPSILLLDEPLSNLDAKLRERMRWELKDLQRRTGITFVYVTHDQSEAMALSDRIAVMHQGALQQVGAPRDVYRHPVSRAVADFMGLVNLLPARVLRTAGDESLVAVGGDHPVAVALPPGVVAGQRVQVAIRPESVRLTPPAPGAAAEAAGGTAEGVGGVPARVADVTFLGNVLDCHVALDDGTRVRVQLDPGLALEVGQRVGLRFDARVASVFAE
jgi:ABC-type Fe3+/spermidine/putrescine transport system ATPase subunit